MNQKYRLNKYGTYILDNQTNKKIFNYANDADDIVDLLNKLYEENKYLKDEVEYLKEENREERLENIRMINRSLYG